MTGQSLGILEVGAMTPGMVAIDAMEKATSVRVLHVELNDLLGVCIKITGTIAAVQTAISNGRRIVEQMKAKCVSSVMAKPAEAAKPALEAQPEYSPLMQANISFFPDNDSLKEVRVSEQEYALGFIETQGYTAVFEAIDSACKAANVEVVGKEKLGGGYITVVIRGDVAAVKAAIGAGTEKVNGLGTLIAAHVIPRPSESVMKLLSEI